MRTRITASSVALAAALAAVSLAPSSGALAARGLTGPVCAWLPDGPTTFDSAAAAIHAHARVIHVGGCQAIGCWSWMGVFRSEPMCGIDPLNKVRMTYPNRCAAEHAQAIWVHDGECVRGR